MFKGKWSRIKTQKIIADGIISNTKWADGRPIPVLIIDATDRPEIGEYVATHHLQPPGDVIVSWGAPPFSKEFVVLTLKFFRPIETQFAIEFLTEKHHALVDGVLHARGFYLQVGIAGASLSANLHDPKIIVEVPDTGFLPHWNRIMSHVLVDRFRKNGFSKREANTAASDYVKTMRQFWAVRRPNVPSEPENA
jgi:hypothetical protein